VEQQNFWRLMVAELQAGPPSMVLQVQSLNTSRFRVFGCTWNLFINLNSIL
jgi:cephalosporin-C deacetylase-like acetyl esterase